MTREVEFGNEIREVETLDIQIGVVVGNSLEVVYRPLASNIIGYDDILDSDVF